MIKKQQYIKIKHCINENLSSHFNYLSFNLENKNNDSNNLNIKEVRCTLNDIIIPSCSLFDKKNNLIYFYDILFFQESGDYFIIIPDDNKVIEILIFNNKKKQFIWNDYYSTHNLIRISNGINICFDEKYLFYKKKLSQKAITDCILEKSDYFLDL